MVLFAPGRLRSRNRLRLPASNTFGLGSIHKLITIDTPHLGSPLAPQLVTTQEDCLQHRILSLVGNFVFGAVQMGTTIVPDAVGDLSPGGQALSNIASRTTHPLPTALIAGVYTDFAGLQTSFKSKVIFLVCGYSDPLAQDIVNPSGWQQLFGDQPNDAIVPESSELDGLSSNLVFTGMVHSSGTEKLGFSAPSVLDKDSTTGIPSAVIKLLNAPVAQGAFVILGP